VERSGSIKLWQPAHKSKVPIPDFGKIPEDYKLKTLFHDCKNVLLGLNNSLLRNEKSMLILLDHHSVLLWCNHTDFFGQSRNKN